MPQGAELDEVPPFAEIAGHGDLRLKPSRQNRSGDFRRHAVAQQAHIGGFGVSHGVIPHGVCVGVIQPGRANNGNFVAELVLAVFTISGTFLRVRRETMPNHFMRDTSVGDDDGGDADMLDGRFVAVSDETAHELFCVTGIALVADAGAAFDVGEDDVGGNVCDNSMVWFTVFIRAPPCDVVIKHLCGLRDGEFEAFG